MDTTPAEDLVKQIWDLGNLITAFTVAQSLTVIYFALEKTNIVRQWLDYAWVAVLFILAGAIVYALAILACYRIEERLRQFLKHPPLVIDTSRTIARARLVTAVMFNCMAGSATVFSALRL